MSEGRQTVLKNTHAQIVDATIQQLRESQRKSAYFCFFEVFMRFFCPRNVLTSRDQLSARESLFQLDLIQLVKLKDMRHFGRIL